MKYFAFLALIFLSGCECLPQPLQSNKITIASFNIEAFGQGKASKPEVMEILAKATTEIGHLPEVITDASSHLAESDVLCLGDFNADGTYFAENTYATVFPPDQFFWLIPNTADTTLAASENTYDRAVATLSLGKDYADQFGVLRFDEVFDFNSLTIKPSDVIDHYPIWTLFYANKDTD